MRNGVLMLCFLLVLGACKKDDTVIPTVFITEIAAPADAAITGISFTSKDSGFAVTENGKLLVTGDGGNTWQVSPNFSFNGYSLHKIEFSTPANGLILGQSTSSGGALFHTANGGKTWAKPFTGDVEDFCFATENIGYYTTSNTGTSHFKTTSGGSSWSGAGSLPFSAFSPQLVAYATKDTGYVLDFNRQLYQTTNGGNNWAQKSFPRGDVVRNIKFFGNKGFGIGRGGVIYKSVNYGNSWSDGDYREHSGFTLWDMDMNGSTGFIVGDMSVLISRDGGDTWTYVYNQFGVNPQETFRSVYAVDENSALATGKSGRIYKIEISR